MGSCNLNPAAFAAPGTYEFRIFRDNKIVANPTLAPDWVNESVHPNPWSPPPSSVLAEPTVTAVIAECWTVRLARPKSKTFA